MVNFLVSVFGYFLIYTACDLKRTEDCKIKTFSREWILKIALVVGGVLLNQIIK